MGGYKFKIIKNYFKKIKIPNIKINVINTGINTNTAGRLLKVKKFLKKDNFFLMTYGDGVSDININQLIKFHQKHNPLITMTAVRPVPRFGIAKIKNNFVQNFYEKPKENNYWINGGFFVINPSVIKLIIYSKSIWEKNVMPKVARKGKLAAFKHNKFWCSMDTLRDKRYLASLIKKGLAKWT